MILETERMENQPTKDFIVGKKHDEEDIKGAIEGKKHDEEDIKGTNISFQTVNETRRSEGRSALR